MLNAHFNKIVLLVSFFVCSSFLFSQKSEITGMIRDSVTHNPIEGVVVKVLDGKMMIAYTLSNKLGEYKLIVENQTQTFSVTFQHIAYKVKSQLISNKSQQLNAELNSKTVTLRETIVEAPIIQVKKDTISFNVASFKSASDRSIEDVIKKLPGMEVSTDGKIAYQGKDISKFNIEGLDMLGGKYTLASRNIQAKDVSRVEVKENYQEVKQLQGKDYSDKVAMNLKLTKEAKMRLLGTMELGGGYRENEGLYHGALTAMAFGKKAQFIGTMKANNFGAPLANEAIDHFGGNTVYNVANGLIGNDLAASAPLEYNRYRLKNDFLTSLNSIFKLSEDKNLRINIDYNREQNEYQYETNSIYSLNNNTVEINEQQTPKYLSSSISANLNYLINSPKLYLNNNTFISTQDFDNHFGLTTNGNQILQQKRSRLSGFKNDLTYLKTIKKIQYNFNSVVNYSHLPENRLIFQGVPGVTGDYFQLSQGESFFTKETVSFGYNVSDISKLSVVADVRIDYDKIYTHLQQNDSASLNQNDGYKIVTSVWPEYRLLSADQRYGFTIGMPVNNYNIGFKNQIKAGEDFYFNRLYLSPWLNAHYIFSAFTKLEISTGITNSIGDISDFIINPIQTSYQNKSAKTGILAINRSLSSSINVEYKNPLQHLFANGSVSYNNVNRNILNSQIISTGNSTIGISSMGVSDRNTSHNSSISGRIDKSTNDMSSSFSLGTNYGFSYGKQMRQGISIDVNSNTLTISPKARTQKIKRFDISYGINYSQTTLNTLNISSTYHQQSHNLYISYNPVNAVVIYSNMDYSRTEITPGNYKNMQFLDAGLRYKIKKFEIEMKLNNLLNTRDYSYVVLRNLDRFSYNYSLNPREFVFVCKFNL